MVVHLLQENHELPMAITDEIEVVGMVCVSKRKTPLVI